MPKYQASVPFVFYAEVKNIEADSPEDALDKAMSDTYISIYCGNGSCDKLIGTDQANISIEAPDQPYESDEIKPAVFDSDGNEIEL